MVKERKRGYLKSQSIQFVLTLFLVVALIGGIHAYETKKNADPIGLKDSVDWVIEPVFNAEWPRFTEGLAPIGIEGEQGFINKKGEVVIPFRYEKAENFHEGLAAVRKEGKWGYIDQKGELKIPFQFEDASDFGNGLAPVKKGGVWVVIDKNGSTMFQTDFTYIYPYEEGVAMVEREIKKYPLQTSCNLIDINGKLLLEKEYEFSGNYREGCIPVFDSEVQQTYYIDINENKVIPRNLIDGGSFRNGYAPVWLKEDEYALIDHSGNVIRRLNESEYHSYQNWHEGLVSYHTGEWGGSGKDIYREGFKDFYGNVIIPAEFRGATDSSDGLIGLMVDGQWGFVENPLPEAARGIDPALWERDRTQIGTVEGLPVYAGELELYANKIMAEIPQLSGVMVYKKAFEDLKAEKAFEKNGNVTDLEKIQYQIGNSYYKKLLMEN